MSYILDALRKADAERERGHVPGIHAQPMFAGAPGATAQRANRPWLWIAVAALVLLVVVLLWALLGRGGTPAPVPAVALTSATPPVAPAPSPAVVPLPAWVATAPAPQASLAAPGPKPALPVAPRPIATKPAPNPKVEANAGAGASAGTGASAPGATSEARVYALNELPDDIRRQLPALAIGGSMYSAKPADRILIINGQVLHEGDKITPELVLQQIKLKAAMLAFKGYRVAITF